MRLIVIGLICSAVVAQAGPFSPPQGCTAHLSVQTSNCMVAHHWTCTADAPGEQWSAEFTQNGDMVYLGKIDHEAQWLDSNFLNVGERETLIAPATDPASLTELFETGMDTYDFKMNTQSGVHRVVGFDRIAQRDVLVDGQRMHRTEYTIRKTDASGALVFAAEGSELVSEQHRRFFSGYGDVTAPAPAYTYNETPIDFIYPGETGFLDNTPRYGCDVLSARAVTQ